MSTKSNIYFHTYYGRTNKLRMAMLSYFYGISSNFRLCLEVFLRRDMGIRYFSLYHAVRNGIVLFFIPFVLGRFTGDSLGSTIPHNWGWYLYLAAYGYFSWQRHKETRRKHGFYDFKHFSYSGGIRLPIVENLLKGPLPPNTRWLDICAEPALAAIVGFLFLLLGQWPIAALLLICAYVYGMSYYAAYEMGKNMILDWIDQHVAAKDIHGVMKGEPKSNSGFEFYGPKPTPGQIRDGIPSQIFVDAEEGAEVR